MATPDVITPYADLDELLVELLGHWERILGDNLAGAYVQGSFALGSGDQQSDCDWLVATHESLTEHQVVGLRELHDEIPMREDHWSHDLEGSYAPIAELASVDHLGRRWLFNDHGHRTLEWDEHCNRASTRWILRQHGITLAGPEPRAFMPDVPAEALRREAAASLPCLLHDLATWIDIDRIAWGQRYAVVTACRIRYTLDTAAVASKAGALEWALSTLEPRWRPLLAQVRDERTRGWNPGQPPRPGEADAARAFVAHAVGLSGGTDAVVRAGPGLPH
ncbi:MAG: aminoglycoside adenylyltransferase domain-containing protein [Nocardioides sp.]